MLRRQCRRRWVRWAARRTRHRDAGLFSVELAVVIVIILSVLLGGIQAFLWFHARNVALSAARSGAETGRRIESTPAEGAAQTRSFLAKFGAKSVHAPAVSTDGSTAETLRIRVTGKVPVLVPGWDLTVDQEAESPRERVTAP